MSTLDELGLDRFLVKANPDTTTQDASTVSANSNSTVLASTPSVPSGSTANDINTNSPAVDVAKLGTGYITSKQITLQVIPTTGDVYIAAGKTDFTNTQTGFILGVDDSDSGKSKFYIGNTTNYLNWDGSALVIAGTITATAGVIGGWTISSSALSTGPFDTFGTMYFGTLGLSLSNTFKVNSDGTINSSAGNIAGWNVSSTSFSTGNFDTNGTMYFGTSGISLSDTFKVTSAGVLTAKSGVIANWNISTDSLSTGNFDTNGTMYFGTSGISLSDTFKVTSAGALTAISGTIANWAISNSSLSTGAFNTNGTMYFGTSGLSLSDTFSVEPDGTITATSGTVGGWTLGLSELYAGASQSKIGLDTSNGIYAGASTFASAPFRVSLGGTLDATNANISGTIDATYITADSGIIGGFTISPTQMYGGIIKTSSSAGAGSNGVILDTAGVRGYSSTLGQVFNLPTDGSAPSFSSGVIQNTIFEVNTNAIIRTSSTVGDGTVNSAGILINNTGLYACEASQTLANANVKVLIDGTAVFNASIRGGQTDYATGTGYFLGLSGGDYKFSIGNVNNYMKWDGTYLILKGSFDVGANGVINNSSYLVANLPVQPTVVGFNNPSAFE